MASYAERRADVQSTVQWLPDWAATSIIMALCLVAGWAQQNAVYRLLLRFGRGKPGFWRSFGPCPSFSATVHCSLGSIRA